METSNNDIFLKNFVNGIFMVIEMHILMNIADVELSASSNTLGLVCGSKYESVDRAGTQAGDKGYRQGIRDRAGKSFLSLVGPSPFLGVTVVVTCLRTRYYYVLLQIYI